MSLKQKEIYEFGHYRLDVDERMIERIDNVPSGTLHDKAFDVLVLLVKKGGHLVTKDELLQHVWPDTIVEENNLEKQIHRLRQFLGEGGTYIETVRRHGYRFVENVHKVEVSRSWLPETLRPSVSTPSTVSEERPAFLSWVSGWRRWVLLAGTFSVIVVVGIAAGSFRGWLPGPLTAGVVSIGSITIVPFKNTSGDPSVDYFAEGVSDELSTRLSQIPDLRMVALPRELRQNRTWEVSEIGRQLGVDGLLMGSASRTAERVLVSVQIVDARTGREIWSNTYDQDGGKVQSLQQEIAHDVVGHIRSSLSPQELERLSRKHQVVPQAYEEFLRGRYYLNLQNRQDQDTAIAALERAVELDPNFSAAEAELAQAYTWKHFSFAPEDKDLAEKAYIASEKALTLDPDSGPAYLARGRLLWTPGNNFPHAKAIRDYKRAIQVSPNLDEARNQLALVFCHIGALDEALQQANEGVRLNPTNNLLLLRIGQTLNSQAKYEEALATLVSIPADVHPSVVGHQIAWALYNLGRKDEAAAKVEQLMKEHPDKGGTFASMQAVLAASNGEYGKAEAFIRQAVEKGKGFGHFHHTAYTIACAYSLMNKTSKALDFLEQAAETGFPCYPMFQNDQNLGNLRSDPRFAAFLAKWKEHWEYHRTLL